MVMFTISVLGKSCQKKKQNCEFKLKFGTKTNSNLQNSIAVFNFSVLDFEYPFGGALFQKIKIIILS